MIYDISVFDFTGEKNLGAAYNRHMQLVNDDDHICFRDGDTCWLTPDYGVHLAEYVRLYPNAVLTCWTNRINERAEQQSKVRGLRDDSDIKTHLQIAIHTQEKGLYRVTPLDGFVSGFCMVVPKSVWLKHKFAEAQVYEDRGPHNLLGVDNDFTNRVRASGVPVLRMDGIYIWHTYRLLTNSKEHLL